MDVPKQNAHDFVEGVELVDTVVSLTGLPEEMVHPELQHILDSAGCNAADLTLDQLRTALLAYLEQLQSEID